MKQNKCPHCQSPIRIEQVQNNGFEFNAFAVTCEACHKISEPSVVSILFHFHDLFIISSFGIILNYSSLNAHIVGIVLALLLAYRYFVNYKFPLRGLRYVPLNNHKKISNHGIALLIGLFLLGLMIAVLSFYLH